jgi:hypothetical protein
MESIIMKILCTGNPSHNTIASAIHRLFPDAEFASRTTGYDLRFWNVGSEDYFRKCIKNYDVFINSSYICSGGQLALLEATHAEWAAAGIYGHIINIGSSAEWEGINTEFGTYSIQKRGLRDRSLQLNGKKYIKTSHIIAGGLNDNLPGHESWLSLDDVATTISWILQNKAQIPLLQIQAQQIQSKQLFL